MGYNKIEALRNNTQAILTAFVLLKTNAHANNAEQDVLNKFSGFGGIKEVDYLTDDYDTAKAMLGDSAHNEIHKLNEYVSEEMAKAIVCLDSVLYYISNESHDAEPKKLYARLANSIKQSVLTAFYTPSPIIAAVSESVSNTLDTFGVKATSILEPSAGAGGFLPVATSDCKRRVAYEKDLVTGMVLAARHPEVDVYIDGFEHVDSTQRFDIAASNFPFGNNLKVYDKTFADGDEFHRSAQGSINSYFPVKSLEMLENGGILAFITSRWFADGANYTEVRRWMVRNGNLLAAVRLPNNTFMDGSGIEVGADLFVFQRDKHKRWQTFEEQIFCETISKTIAGQTIEGINRLMALPKQCLYTDFRVVKGQWNKVTTEYRYTKGADLMQQELAKRLTASMQRHFCKSAWLYGHDVLRKLFEERVRMSQQTTDNRQQDNRQRTTDNRQRTRQQRRATASEIKGEYTQLLACYKDLMDEERETRKPATPERERLNTLYDRFVSKYGSLHAMKEVIEKMPFALMAMSLENVHYEGNTMVAEKSDVFRKPVAFTYIEPGTVFSPADALAMCVSEYGKVDMSRLKELTGMEASEVYEALRGEIFFVSDNVNVNANLNDNANLNVNDNLNVNANLNLNVNTNCQQSTDNRQQSTVKFIWQTKSECINGNVIQKHRENEASIPNATIAYENTSHAWLIEALKDTAEALKNAIPTPIAYQDIDILLGSRWMPLHYFTEFGNELFRSEGLKVMFVKGSDQFVVNKPSSWSSNQGDGGIKGPWSVCGEVSNRRFSGFDCFEYAINDKCPTVLYDLPYGNGKATDTECMRLIQSKIDKIRREFVLWVKNLPEKDQRELAQLYNELYNCSVKAKFDGSNQTFPGLTYANMPFNDAYQAQKDGIAMVKQLNGGILWFNVGAGKTFIMCVAAYEMHRLGTATKPIIIGLKANVHQIADTFQKLYPTGRMLYPGKEDFTKKNCEEFLMRIANNDWDVIIMTHEQFMNIPQHEETEIAIMEEELNDIRDSIKYIDDDRDARRAETAQMRSGLKRRLANAEAKMFELRDRVAKRKGNVLDFHTMGIDHIFVDEYQRFKNLQFSSRHDRVAGLGNSKGSQRSYNLLVAIRDMQMRRGTDMCATFLSGTIVTNSLSELYTAFKYLRPSALAAQNIRCFDAWAAQFAQKSSDFELTITQSIRMKERFRTYINVPELSQFLREITDYRSASMLNLDIPRQNNIEDFADPTPEQQMLLKRLVTYADGADWSCLGLPECLRPRKKENSKSDSRMLIATDIARKVSLDPRAVADGLFSDHPQSKASRCAARIASYYYKFDEHKGTQFVFSDISVPASSSKERKVQFSIYDEVKRKLVEDYGIPAEEIVFAQNLKCESKRAAAFEAMNEGRVRVIFGGTENLGTGVNAQRRAVAVHHLDIPWRPADLEQRNGRAVRKGNEVKLWGGNQVDVIMYGTNNTLDSYKCKLLAQKDLFIRQLTSGNIGRHLDEGAVETDGEGNTAMNYAEYVALLSGNTDILELSKLENKIMALESDQAAHQRAQNAARRGVADAEHCIETARERMKRLQEDLDAINPELLQNAEHHIGLVRLWEAAKAEAEAAGENAPLPPASPVLDIPSAKDNSVVEQGRSLLTIRKKNTEARLTQIGTWCGLAVNVACTSNVNGLPTNRFTVTLPCGAEFPKEGISLGQSFMQAVSAFDHIGNTLRNTIAGARGSIEYNESQLAIHRSVLSKDWDGNTELIHLTEQRDELRKKINDQIEADKEARSAEAEKAARADKSSKKS